MVGWADGQVPHHSYLHVDGEIAEDMLMILGYLAQNNVTYADAWGRGRDMEQLVEARRG